MENNMTSEKYAISIRTLHWAMAVAFLIMWGTGIGMGFVTDESATHDLMTGLHISTGALLAILLIIRIVCRFATRTPAETFNFPLWERIGAKLGHVALYLLPLIVIAIGWAGADLGGHGVTMFGIPMPKLLPTIDNWERTSINGTFEELHEILAFVMLGVTVVHIAAVLKHKYMDHQDVLPRMTISRTDKSS